MTYLDVLIDKAVSHFFESTRRESLSMDEMIAMCESDVASIRLEYEPRLDELQGIYELSDGEEVEGVKQAYLDLREEMHSKMLEVWERQLPL